MTDKIQNSQEVLDGYITQAQLNQWKYKHGKVIKLSIQDDDGTMLYAYFCKPTIATRAAVLQASEMDSFKALQVLFKNCYLGGDATIEQDDDLRLNITTSFSDYIKPKPVQVTVL